MRINDIECKEHVPSDALITNINWEFCLFYKIMFRSASATPRGAFLGHGRILTINFLLNNVTYKIK